MIRLIDSAAVLNSSGFSFSGGNFITSPLIMDELRDLRSRHLAENALQNSLLSLQEPTPLNIKKIQEIAAKHGFEKLSKADISLLALALDLKAQGKKFILISDDYSVQNFCKLLGIKFDSVIRGKIEKTISFKKECSGCRKKFPASTALKKCPDCGSCIISKKSFKP